VTRLQFFAGKGGVGKTTCAAACAVARARRGDRTLLVSTDPAPSVADVLGQRLSAAPRAVAGTRGRLKAVEVDARAALDRWLKPRRAAFEAIVLRGSWLDEDDVEALLRQSLPGIDEIAALMEIGRFVRAARYDAVIVDTAPTGHTLRMLAMPRLLGTIAAVFDEMQSKHRALVAALRGSWTPEAADAQIAELDAEATSLETLLRDRRHTAMSWITLPEPMAVAETIDGLRELRRLGVRVDRLVVNRLTPAPDRRCAWCSTRRRLERAAIQPLVAGGEQELQTAAVFARPREPRGVAALLEFAREMDGPARFPPVRSTRSQTMTGVPSLAGDAVALPAADLSLIMFGGKGGVGKTTCGAAAAMDVAARHPERPVLVLSTDPAHSLGDVLGVPLGNDARGVPGAPSNLRARELDAPAGFDRIKTRYREAIDSLFARFAQDATASVATDRQALRDLMELAPPGLDELMAIVEVSETLGSPSGNPLLVVDTAPSGHALRLLQMPALIHDWVKALMTILLKYQSVTPAGELGALLLQMSQGLGRLRALLADPARTALVIVSRPAELPMAETRRLIPHLERLKLPIAALLVNDLGRGTCSACATASGEQQRVLRKIERSRTVAGRTLIVAPAVLPPPGGPAALRNWRRLWKTQQRGISSRAWPKAPRRRAGRTKRS
jgi:arsenite-transporting ATPase